jgi:hypothetical protein
LPIKVIAKHFCQKFQSQFFFRETKIKKKLNLFFSSRSKLFCPFPRSFIMCFSVLYKLLRDAANQRIARIRISQKRADRQEHLGNGQCRAPIVLEHIQANLTLAIDVAVINACAKCNSATNRKEKRRES